MPLCLGTMKKLMRKRRADVSTILEPAAFDEQESSAQLLQFVELMAGDEHGDAAVAIPPKPHKFKHRADWEVRAAGRTITV